MHGVGYFCETRFERVVRDKAYEVTVALQPEVSAFAPASLRSGVRRAEFAFRRPNAPDTLLRTVLYESFLFSFSFLKLRSCLLALR